MEKDFDKWNKIKKETQNKDIIPLFSECEVWWCSLGVNIGSEEDGKGENYLRPVLILRKFNKSVFYGLPITSKPKDDQFHISINTGDISGSLILSQMRLIDAKRLSHLAVKITTNELKEIRKKLKELFP
ncbi:MAG: type II toxin-antitoxin system PemK/MazF family toxin [Patescibacteria group bacterium]